GDRPHARRRRPDQGIPGPREETGQPGRPELNVPSMENENGDPRVAVFASIRFFFNSSCARRAPHFSPPARSPD
ncbi:hypothetical protein TI06_23765, partial [Vibrio vulnificus]